MTLESERPTNYDAFIAPYLKARASWSRGSYPRITPQAATWGISIDWSHPLSSVWGFSPVPIDKERRPLIPFHRTPFHQIAALDERLSIRQQEYLTTLCDNILYPPGERVTTRVQVATLFFPIFYIESAPHTLVGLCAEEKTMGVILFHWERNVVGMIVFESFSLRRR